MAPKLAAVTVGVLVMAVMCYVTVSPHASPAPTTVDVTMPAQGSDFGVTSPPRVTYPPPVTHAYPPSVNTAPGYSAGSTVVQVPVAPNVIVPRVPVYPVMPTYPAPAWHGEDRYVGHVPGRR